MTTSNLEMAEVLKAERQTSNNSKSQILLSAIVITKNETENIHKCLASLQWTDEIVVVDAESADATVALAKEFTDKVFVRSWEGYVAAKSFALAQCAGEWVLWVDADERVPSELRHEITARLAITRRLTVLKCRVWRIFSANGCCTAAGIGLCLKVISARSRPV
jgi:cellulose synthase/poly-beta-1,6-N-acetylglucosamine synthase-like glycosyltransferase